MLAVFGSTRAGSCLIASCSCPFRNSLSSRAAAGPRPLRSATGTAVASCHPTGCRGARGARWKLL
eukprot:4905413-Alexandrium_andersonii.AAC.1